VSADAAEDNSNGQDEPVTMEVRAIPTTQAAEMPHFPTSPVVLCGHYELQPSPRYAAPTTLVYTARDLSQGGAQVHLKFIQSANAFHKELYARNGDGNTAAAFSHAFTVPVLSSHSADKEPNLQQELASLPHLASRPFILVLPVWERLLSQSIANERYLPSWLSEVRLIARQLAEAIGSIHVHGWIHGDVRPQTVARIGGVYKFCDLDLIANFFKADLAARKITVFSPPEVIAILPGKAHRAHASIDAWGLGATLYQMITGATLAQGDTADAVFTTADLRILATWTDETKTERLAKVVDVHARHLIGLLLSRDPAARPGMSQVLLHPFLAAHSL
jgi:serine/threonine protein kinase